MLRTWNNRILPLALLSSWFWHSAAFAQAGCQQRLELWKSASDPIEKWMFINGQKLAEFMPRPVPGLVGHLPWEASDDCLPHLESYVHHQYIGLSVEKVWAFDDPQLYQQVAQAQQRFNEAKKKTESPESIQNVQARGKVQAALNAQYLKEYDELWKQGKHKEALEVMEKRANDPAFQPPPEYEERSRLEQQLRDLEAKGQKLILDIEASYPPLNWPLLKPIGTLKGYPLFRGVQQDVFLAVYMGPQGFRNLPAGKEPQKMQMKCFLVQAQFPPGERHEELARQMLENIDYEVLARLIEP
jgi:hypothetical protein